MEVFKDADQDQIAKVKEIPKDAQEQANNMADLHKDVKVLNSFSRKKILKMPFFS